MAYLRCEMLWYVMNGISDFDFRNHIDFLEDVTYRVGGEI